MVIFLADDQGWGDLSLHGNKDLATPNIDSLAREGVSFDQFFVCAVCSPTRAEFLTGRYHPRMGVYGTSRGSERMDLDERTVSDAFHAAGYATGCFGKWHNGMQYPYHPRGRGFDAFVGFCSGHWGDYFDAELERDGVYFQSKGYITDVVTDEAIRFIEDNASDRKPFFCYVPLPTPHSPMQVPDQYWDKHKDKPFKMKHKDADDHTRAAFAMVENIDDNVGRVLKKLDELELAEETIVIYFSDNGPNGWRWNGGMSGRKGWLSEGGLRSPLHLRWPSKIKEPKQVKRLAGAIDLYPTLIGLAEIDRVGDKPFDGEDLAPALLSESTTEAEQAPREIFSHQRGQVSLRAQDKRFGPHGKLYDIRSDPGQKKNLAKENPQLAQEMRSRVKAWRKDVGLDGKRQARPFLVGHADWPFTELPARDATTRGGIKRSSKHPNCSYFFDWKTTDDAIVWDAQVLTAGRYEVQVYYACPAKDAGSTIELSFASASIQAQVTGAHNPPIDSKARNIVETGESHTKPFKPMTMGVIDLPKGRGEMTLRATDIPGRQAMEFRRLIFKRVD